MDIKRPHSAPGLLETTGMDYDASSEAPSYDYTTSSDTDGEHEPEGEEFRRNKKNDTSKHHGCLSRVEHQVRSNLRRYQLTASTALRHALITQYAHGLRILTVQAMEGLMEGEPNASKPPPTLMEENPYESFLHFTGGVEPGSLKNEVSVENEGNPTPEQVLSFDLGSQDGKFSLNEFATLSVDQGESSFTQHSSFDQQSPGDSEELLAGNRRLHRKDASYYFGPSQDLKDEDGDALITARARVSRDV